MDTKDKKGNVFVIMWLAPVPYGGRSLAQYGKGGMGNPSMNLFFIHRCLNMFYFVVIIKKKISEISYGKKICK